MLGAVLDTPYWAERQEGGHHLLYRRRDCQCGDFNMLHSIDVPCSVPIERWDVEHLDASAESQQSNALRFASFMTDASQFDSEAFRLGYGEGMGMDPQSRMLLEEVFSAMQVCFLLLLYATV